MSRPAFALLLALAACGSDGTTAANDAGASTAVERKVIDEADADVAAAEAAAR